MDNIKSFDYKTYKNCYFIVSSYTCDPMAMAISIFNNSDGDITTVTVYMDGYVYAPGLTAIKNYSENTGITKFLQELGIIEEILDRRPPNQHVAHTLNTPNPETIDWCVINTDKLKEYTKEWYYNV